MIEILSKPVKELRVLREALNIENLKEALVSHKPKVLLINCHGGKKYWNFLDPHSVPTTYLSIEDPHNPTLEFKLEEYQLSELVKGA